MSSSGAHPRSRGENVTTVTKARAIEGSSPLTRGKRVRGLRKAIQARLIPAHAGKTPVHGHLQARQWAHPRSRGENTFKNSVASHRLGSSPLTRGKPLMVFISVFLSVAHPRSRGENLPGPRHCPAGWRLIPAHAGKTPHDGALTRRRRLIPAHAGKTLDNMFLAIVSAAHPRSRGENSTGDMESEAALGSSPLTRGKLLSQIAAWLPTRLIPAHAGKTSRVWSQSSGRGAHPRSRGENDQYVRMNGR